MIEMIKTLLFKKKITTKIQHDENIKQLTIYKIIEKLKKGFRDDKEKWYPICSIR